MNIHVEKIRLGNRDVSVRQTMRPSALFSYLQEAATTHADELGIGRGRTLDQGLLWVLVRQRAEITRMPGYCENVVLETWPGLMKHMFYPRYYRIADTEGNPLVLASSLWAIIDSASRSLLLPAQSGITVPTEVTGNEISLPASLKKLTLAEHTEFTVPYSYIDLNGHMNNVKYLDLAEDLIPDTAAAHTLKAITIEYANEAKLSENIMISYGNEENIYYFSGDGDKHKFSLKLEYAD